MSAIRGQGIHCSPIVETPKRLRLWTPSNKHEKSLDAHQRMWDRTTTLTKPRELVPAERQSSRAQLPDPHGWEEKVGLCSQHAQAPRYYFAYLCILIHIIFIYTYAYKYATTHVCIHLHTYTHTHKYIYMYVYVCMCIYIYTQRHTRMHACLAG